MKLTHSTPSRRRASIAAALLVLSGLASAVQPAAAPAPDAASAAAGSSVDQLIGAAPCDTQSQCHSIGIGAKPCGGPRAWRAWSDKKTDKDALEAAVQAQALGEKKAAQADGLASDCMMTPQPNAVCRPHAPGQPKSCELGQGGADSAV